MRAAGIPEVEIEEIEVLLSFPLQRAVQLLQPTQFNASLVRVLHSWGQPQRHYPLHASRSRIPAST